MEEKQHVQELNSLCLLHLLLLLFFIIRKNRNSNSYDFITNFAYYYFDLFMQKKCRNNTDNQVFVAKH